MSRRHREQPPPTETTNVVGVLRALAGPAFVIGGWELMPLNYWVGLMIVYGGFLFCIAEFIWEPALLARPYVVQVGLVLSVLVACAGFTIGFVLVSAPINTYAFATNIDYSSSGNAPGGISWHPFYRELDLIITNPTADDNYENIDVLVRPSLPVAVIVQVSNLSEVSFEDEFGLTLRSTVEDLSTKSPTVPMTFLATNAGYKVHCGRIPPNTSLRLILAIVELKKAGPPKPIPYDLPLTQFAMEANVSNTDGRFTYWYGSQSNSGLFVAEPSMPKTVLVRGSYTAHSRRRSVNQTVPIS